MLAIKKFLCIMFAILEMIMTQEVIDLMLEEEITAHLIDMKICPNLRGFRFILDGVKIILCDACKKRKINNVLYNDIALSYDTDRVTVDGALRHAIDIAYNRGGFKTFSKDYDYVIKRERPTPRELLSALVIKLKNKGKDEWL